VSHSADRRSEGVQDPSEGEGGALRRLLESRHSCRHFLPRPVEREVIEEILAVAQRSASWCNTQPWQLHITEGAGTEALRAGLVQYAAANAGEPDLTFPARYARIYDERRRTCALQLYEQVGVERGDRVASREQTSKNFELFDAPHVAILTTERDPRRLRRPRLRAIRPGVHPRGAQPRRRHDPAGGAGALLAVPASASGPTGEP